MFEAKIYITFKEGVVDPQGITIKGALESLGYKGVSDVRMGKYIQVKLNTQDKERAEVNLKKMCAELLANPVIEDYRYEIAER
ncbi:MAG: phosphoribosylformylglycinamidine synthase subunit PurS [bacterium]